MFIRRMRADCKDLRKDSLFSQSLQATWAVELTEVLW